MLYTSASYIRITAEYHRSTQHRKSFTLLSRLWENNNRSTDNSRDPFELLYRHALD